MAVTKSAWVEVASDAKLLLKIVKDIVPKGPFTIPTMHGCIVGMFWRSVRLYEGSLLLLEAELPEEAAILSRSLFEGSLQLRQLANQHESRDSLIFGWLKDSIKEKIGLIKTAESVGLESDAHQMVTILETERAQMQDYFKRRHVVKSKPLLSVKDAALQFDRKEAYWTYAWSHEAVHGSDAAWLFGRRKVAADTLALFSKTNDVELLVAFLAFASDSLIDAADATASIMGWPSLASARELSDRIHNAAERQPGQGRGRSR